MTERDARPRLSTFAACPHCGKERPVSTAHRDDDEGMLESYRRLAEVSFCRACSAEVERP